ncbi:MAG: hypothetical protein F6K36_29800, partial [Symploca sp. SIO3C6]|nr:hypothetical protein [Symploca sp. SIO3C6]
SLAGQYDVTRNGDRIRCRVVKAIPEAESLGTWHLLRDQLIDGDTLLFDLGNGTTEEWVIDRNGEIIDGNATDSFPVSGLVGAIAKDPLIRGKLCPLAEQSPNTDLIVRALRSGSIADIPLERWEAVKQQHIDEWWTQIKSYLLKAHGSTLQSVANVIFTGGGTELIRNRLPKQFLSPEQPQSASVRGMYAHYHSQIASGVVKFG